MQFGLATQAALRKLLIFNCNMHTQPLPQNATLTNKWITLTECPRDAMQGWPTQISTSHKIIYLNALIAAQLDILDCGSFVSAKAIPQMADTAEVLKSIDTSNLNSKLLAIVANERGATEAAPFEMLSYLGFPFSIAPTFQLKNTNKTISQSLQTLEAIQTICVNNNKALVVYISMAFGNPYGDAYNYDVVINYLNKIIDLGVKDIRLADTVGLATEAQVKDLTQLAIKASANKAAIGLHLHGTAKNSSQKILAGLQAGCLRFDAAIGGFGGCPLAGTNLVGNIDTLLFLNLIEQENYYCQYHKTNLLKAKHIATEIFI
jgi:hydroxymethylglutaryl-CoA lyase